MDGKNDENEMVKWHVEKEATDQDAGADEMNCEIDSKDSVMQVEMSDE